jgi:methylmalonyl-CoA mutase C-terminal domain/subunit
MICSAPSKVPSTIQVYDMSGVVELEAGRVSNHKTRCLLGMLGTDVHSKGLRIIAQYLRDEGFEVIYGGEHHTVESLVSAAVQEDVDLIGLSFSSTAYVDYTLQLVETLRGRGADDIAVMIGGQIHPDDYDVLRSGGVEGVFGPGFKMEEMFNFVRAAGERRAAA